MKHRDLEKMNDVLELKLKERQRTFSKVVAAENRLRAELAKLDSMASNAARSEHEYMRSIGADIIWKAWLGRTKTSLNTELAQVLAQKDTLIKRVRKDYGRLLTSRALLDQHKAALSHRKQSRVLGDILNQHMIDRTYRKS